MSKTTNFWLSMSTILILLRLPLFSIAAEQPTTEIFTDNFTDKGKIGAHKGIIIDTNISEVKLAESVNFLSNEDTLLLSHLDSDADITSPTIGKGGEVNGVTYEPGYEGNCAIINDGSILRFPIKGNLNKHVGTISMWVKLPDWNKNAYFFSAPRHCSDFCASQNFEHQRITW